ncbi:MULTISPECIES: serine/threonine-protein kinase [unclassified Microcystis]|uniref:serine/threonine-protein kinase n=1 Tax=unclassified Microcystis TaxID=2643300 RepID=UPI002582EBD4|nr:MULTISPECIES: serine/threonine-protein kinase [unclassified Microcystis]MCA2764323.1 serine/threonine protein kinase [Microcystis sp. M151S2]MCA2642354.1 serine/threonine protein kinase [Microcystis sp. M087S2]MCA2669881.1 serine/threonine protein kinase [Microcystis sp. M080S2]MCA2688671.1 serine/threonine protein kinase [Microcystis sp. M037S2]MCA2734717.1 serine/threonine protein kinase [Microcystis sp. M158S2]
MKTCYCINPDCSQPEHPSNNNSNTRYCQSCGSQLLLNGQYRVSRLLSDTTGFGVVYEAFEGFTAKILKVLQEKWNNEPKAVELFKREYDVLLELSRQNVTGVPRGDAYFQYSTREGKILHCLVMEKVEGINLEQWLKQYDNLSQKRALKWLREITLILDKIHQQNWLHRDIKPPNIMLRNSGELVLIDFGTAREETQTYHQKVKGQQVTGITSAGYTPNEQQHGQAVIQSDFHALGRTFVHLLTRKHPLEIYDPVNDVLSWREETENIHPLLLDFIEELMEKLPENRPANTRVILQRLDEIERQLKLPPTPAPNPQPVVTKKQSPVIPKINPSPPVSPVAVPKKTPAQPVKNNNLRNRMIALGSILLLGIGITQVYGYFKYKQFPAGLQLLISNFPSGSFLEKTLTGHSDSVLSAAYSSDSRYLASGSGDNTIKIWEVAKGKELRTLTGHSSGVYSVVYSPDGRYLASGSGDNTIKIWEVAKEKELRTLTGHSSRSLSVVYSPDSRYLASGSIDNTIKIWEVATGKELRTLTGHFSGVYSVVYSPDGRYLASASADNTIKIWEVATGKELRTLTGHSDSVWSVAYSPDGRYLASGNYDNTIKIWEVATGKELRTLTGHSNSVPSVAYSPDGRYLASGSWDDTIKIWEVATGRELRTLTGHSSGFWSVVYSPDGRYLASGSGDRTIKIWRVGQ